VKVKPLEDFVVVKMKDADTHTPGGIVLPDEVKKPKFGRVIAVGPGKYDTGIFIEMKLKPGDTVVCPPYCNELELDGETFRLYRASDIAAVLEE
jgi:chaperonin GroES